MPNPNQQNPAERTIKNVSASNTPALVLNFGYVIEGQPFEVSVEFGYDTKQKQINFFMWMCNEDNRYRAFIGEGEAKCDTAAVKEHIQIINDIMLSEETLHALSCLVNHECHCTCADCGDYEDREICEQCNECDCQIKELPEDAMRQITDEVTCIATPEQSISFAYCLGDKCADIMVQYSYCKEEKEIELSVWLYGERENGAGCYSEIGCCITLPCDSDDPEEHIRMVTEYMQSQPTICHIANNAWNLEFDCSNCEWECIELGHDEDEEHDGECEDDCTDCEGPSDCQTCGIRSKCGCAFNTLRDSEGSAKT